MSGLILNLKLLLLGWAGGRRGWEYLIIEFNPLSTAQAHHHLRPKSRWKVTTLWGWGWGWGVRRGHGGRGLGPYTYFETRRQNRVYLSAALLHEWAQAGHQILTDTRRQKDQHWQGKCLCCSELNLPPSEITLFKTYFSNSCLSYNHVLV